MKCFLDVFELENDEILKNFYFTVIFRQFFCPFLYMGRKIDKIQSFRVKTTSFVSLIKISMKSSLFKNLLKTMDKTSLSQAKKTTFSEFLFKT